MYATVNNTPIMQFTTTHTTKTHASATIADRSDHINGIKDLCNANVTTHTTLVHERQRRPRSRLCTNERTLKRTRNDLLPRPRHGDVVDKRLLRVVVAVRGDGVAVCVNGTRAFTFTNIYDFTIFTRCRSVHM